MPASPGGIKRPVKSAKKLEGADSRELKDLVGEEDFADAPKRKAAAPPKPPPYQQVHRAPARRQQIRSLSDARSLCWLPCLSCLPAEQLLRQALCCRLEFKRNA